MLVTISLFTVSTFLHKFANYPFYSKFLELHILFSEISANP